MEKYEPGIWMGGYEEHLFYKCTRCGKTKIVPKYGISRRY